MTGLIDDLIARLEAATEDSAELLIDCYHALNGGKLFDQPASPNFVETYNRWRRFKAMLDARAYESAALTLVPANAIGYALGKLKGKRSAAQIGFGGEPESVEAEAKTPAHAICIAALRGTAPQ